MSAKEETRAAISALLDAGKTPTVVAKVLKVSRNTFFCRLARATT